MPPPSPLPERIPPQQWLHLYRALLRQCSYLPDPIARTHMHHYVVSRFRRYADDRRPWLRDDTQKPRSLFASARSQLQLLERANEGYSRPLEKVLRHAYGRKGVRRRQLLDELSCEVPENTAAVVKLIQKPRQFEDGWEPPAVLMDLLKSQQNNGTISQLNHRQVKNWEPVIPTMDTWDQPIKIARRRNIRRKWYASVLESLLPPLPDADLAVLEGLISGTVRWERPRRRRTPLIPPPIQHLDSEFLTDGPKKGHTFREYANGRPHEITRRFMTRLWQRISCMVPRVVSEPGAPKTSFVWDTMRPMPSFAAAVKDHEEEVFQGVDEKGRVCRAQG